jgi:hypothetical protein
MRAWPACQKLCVTVTIASATAGADVRGTLRVGVEPLSLAPSSSTPVLGGYFDEAVMAYDAASTAYNRAHGYAAGSAQASPPLDRSALGIHADMLSFAPGIEIGGEHFRLRAEALLGFADSYRRIGVALYPLDIAIPLGRGTITPYVAAGGTASWLERTDVSTQSGALLSARAALGLRVRRVTIEVGYSMLVVGGTVDTQQLHSMTMYDPRSSAPPPAPSKAFSGGEDTGMVDVSIGVTL